MQGADDAYSRGIDNLADGRFAEAVADFTQAIELDPQRANAYRLRGIAYNPGVAVPCFRFCCSRCHHCWTFLGASAAEKR
jgi:tetratricopeptide (TPR) repeat protein